MESQCLCGNRKQWSEVTRPSMKTDRESPQFPLKRLDLQVVGIWHMETSVVSPAETKSSTWHVWGCKAKLLTVRSGLFLWSSRELSLLLALVFTQKRCVWVSESHDLCRQFADMQHLFYTKENSKGWNTKQYWISIWLYLENNRNAVPLTVCCLVPECSRLIHCYLIYSCTMHQLTITGKRQSEVTDSRKQTTKQKN